MTTTLGATTLPSTSRSERLRSFGAALDALKERIEGEIGPDDVQRVRGLDTFSRVMEVIGRVLIHVSFEPILFSLGVTALWVHKQLQATEIGHTALHGAYDKLVGASRFHSKRFRWDTPIDEASWHYGHNVRHHGATNVAGKDADIHFGQIRLTEQTPWQPKNAWQTLFALFFLFPNFGFLMNIHFTGLNDLLDDNGLPTQRDFMKDRSAASWKQALTRAFRKWGPHYAKEYVLFPLLAGPFFWKVMLGNWLAATLRDLYSAFTIICGHVGDDVASYPMGTRPAHRGEWYAMQVEATNDFEVPYVLSVFCGGLDKQIEHHLFPKLPPERLRQIAPEVRAICEAHGVAYHTDTWPRTIAKAMRHIDALSRPGEGGPLAVGRRALRAIA